MHSPKTLMGIGNYAIRLPISLLSSATSQPAFQPTS